MEVNKTLILNTLQSFYKFNKDSDFAKFLDIKPSVLSNWKARNTFDIEILYTKCELINPEFLITGKGEIERINVNQVSEPSEFYIVENKLLVAHKKTIEVLETVVTDLRNDKELLHQIIKNCFSNK